MKIGITGRGDPSLDKSWIAKQNQVDGLHSSLDDRQSALRLLQAICDVEIEVCAEPGFPCTGCVSSIDLEILNLSPPIDGRKGQRRA